MPLRGSFVRWAGGPGPIRLERRGVLVGAGSAEPRFRYRRIQPMVILSTVTAYLLGSVPFGYLIVRWRRGIDVRKTGSGATGATNVMRSTGVGGFVATFVLDFGKGVAAVWLASRLTGNDPRAVAAAAFAAVLGHVFPVWLGFRGGKGVATGVGVFVALAPVPLGVALLIFAVLVAMGRYISLGSIVATGAFPVLLYFEKHPPMPTVLGAAATAALILAKHAANIRRLLAGTESRLGPKKPERGEKHQAEKAS